MAKSYKDPGYDDIDSSVEQRLGLPSGLLSDIRLKGERSNADQVSSSGARTVYQVTPTTRELVLKKYGVDAYRSPADAALAAGHVLKEGLQRNKGDQPAAIREYIGGTNPANYGPTTAQYVKRVLQDRPLSVDELVNMAGSKSPQPLSVDEIIAMAGKVKPPAVPKKPTQAPSSDIAAAALSRGTRDVIEGAASGIGTFVDPFIEAIGAGVRGVTGSDYQPATVTGVGRKVADVLGLEKPQTEQQRLISQVAQGATGALSGAGVAAPVARIAAGPVARGVAAELAAAPATQAVSGGAAAGAAEEVRQRGGGTAAQIAAGLAGGAAGATRLSAARQAAENVGVLKPAIQVPGKPNVRPKIPQIGEQSAEEVAKQIAKSAGDEGSAAARMLAQQVDADPRKVKAAINLGVAENLQADQVSRNQSFREVAQLLKSQTGSVAHRQEVEGLEAITGRANKIIEDAGGTSDVSMLDFRAKGELSRLESEAKNKARQAYETLRSSIGESTPVQAANFEAYIQKRAQDLGGFKYLEPVERSLYARLNPATSPTYARLDDAVKQINAAMADKFGKSKFADAGSHRLAAIKDALEPDRAAVVEQLGLKDQYDLANLSTVAYKNLQQNQVDLFGKRLADSMAPKLRMAATALTKGNVAPINKIFAAAPKEMHGEIAASALRTLFGREGPIMSFSKFAQSFDGLKANRQAFTAIMSKLPAKSRREVLDLYRVSDGIRKASKEYITTGKALNPAALDIIRKADGLMGTVKRLASSAAAGLVGSAVGGVLGGVATGAAGAMAARALDKNKQRALTLADELIASPEFYRAATAAASGKGMNHPAMKSFNNSRQWKEFVRILPPEQQSAAKAAGIHFLISQTQSEQAE